MTLDDEGERVDASAASPMVVGCERGDKGFPERYTKRRLYSGYFSRRIGSGESASRIAHFSRLSNTVA